MELITKEILIHYTHFSKAVRVFGVVKVILPSDQIFQSQPRQPFHFPICPRLDQERRTQPDKINFIPGENVLDKKRLTIMEDVAPWCYKWMGWIGNLQRGVYAHTMQPLTVLIIDLWFLFNFFRWYLSFLGDIFSLFHLARSQGRLAADCPQISQVPASAHQRQYWYKTLFKRI